jgi:hypothetical protein
MADDTTPPDDTPDPEPDDQPDDEPEVEYKPPSKEEWEKARGAAKKARDERDKIRAELAASRREKQTEEEKAADRAAEQEKWQRTAVTNAAVGELQAAGYTKAQARRLSKLIDLSNVDIDDDGEVDLEEEIEQLAKDFPPDKSVARGGSRVTTGRGREDSQPKDDVDTRFAKRLLGMR